MTFNILYAAAPHPAGDWSARFPLVTDVISHWQPHIIGLQEADGNQLEDLARALPEYEILAGPPSGPSRLPVWARTLSPALATIGLGIHLRPTSKLWKMLASALIIGAALPAMGTMGSRLYCSTITDCGEHCALLYRRDDFERVSEGAFWLSQNPARYGSVLLGSWLPRVVNWIQLKHSSKQQEFTVFNTHLDYLPWASTRSGRLLRRHLDRNWDGHSTQILLGDFNATAKSAMHRTLTASGNRKPLRDAWTEAFQQKGPEGTFHDGRGRVRWPGRIDHIVLRTFLPIGQVCTITDHDQGGYPSDHFPVLAELRLD